MSRDNLARRQLSRLTFKTSRAGASFQSRRDRARRGAPILQKLRARELYSDDLPAACLRLLYGLTDDTPIDVARRPPGRRYVVNPQL